MIADLLFPRFCFGCGYLGTYICPACERKLAPLREDRCLSCGKPSLCGLTHPRCKKRNGVDGAVSLYRYEPVMRGIIKNIKYRLVTDAWRELFLVGGTLWFDKLHPLVRLYPNLSLVPIPLSKEKLRWRGFNQSAVIASFLASHFHLPTGNCLRRLRDTAPQAQVVARSGRRANVRRCFHATHPPREVLLVDDVVTTGATAAEAAATLKRAGASRVFVFSLAKG